MSHFFTLALLPPGTPPDDAEKVIGQLLKPYDESIEMPRYEEECGCIGGTAMVQARKETEANALAKFGKGLKDYRDEHVQWRQDNKINSWDSDLSKDEAKRQHEAEEAHWEELTKDYFTFVEVEQKRLYEAHPLKDTADPHCGYKYHLPDDLHETPELATPEQIEAAKLQNANRGEGCNGTGTATSVYNPRSHWDWWEIGGRWTGELSGYDPTTDPANQEQCDLCGGTGDRATYRNEPKDDQHPSGCNSCLGKGMRTKWSTQWRKHAGDISPVKSVIDKLTDDPPYALVTPDGEWHERGRMGWWGMSSGDMPRDEWGKQVRALLESNSDSLAVVVDAHI